MDDIQRVSVSVIIPFYNAAPYLGRCVQSLLDQTSRDFELLLVDDGSTDNSHAVATRLLEPAGVRFRIIAQPNTGPGAARNRGLDAAESEFVAFVDADDVLDKDFIRRKIGITRSSSADFYTTWPFTMAACDRRADLSGVAIRTDDYLAYLNALSCYESAIFANLYRKSFLDRHNIRFPRLHYTEDKYFISCCLLSADSVYVDSYSGYVIEGDNAGSLTRMPNYLRLAVSRAIVADLLLKRFFDTALSVPKRAYLQNRVEYLISNSFRLAKALAKPDRKVFFQSTPYVENYRYMARSSTKFSRRLRAVSSLLLNGIGG